MGDVEYENFEIGECREILCVFVVLCDLVVWLVVLGW